MTEQLPDENASVYKNTLFYSKANEELMSFLMANEEETALLAKQAKGEDLMDVSYDLSAWPALINKQKLADFDQFVKNVPTLFEKAIKIFFAQDSQLFATYLDEPQLTHEQFLEARMDKSDLVSRYDLVYSGATPKLLEVNVSSNLGGWELDWLHLKALNATNNLPFIQKYKLSYHKVVKSLFNGLGKSIARLKKENKTGNILICTEIVSAEVSAGLSQFAQMNYQTSGFYQKGQVFLTPDSKKIQFDAEGNVSYNGISYDAVMLLDKASTPDEIMDQLISSYMAKKIIFPDSPVHKLYGNKMLMALVHEEKVKARLTDEEVRWIEKYIPWTARNDQQHITWNNNVYPRLELLMQQKDAFVLKKAQSLQGKDVIVGKFTGQEEWDARLESLAREPGWIIQAYCSPDVIFASDGDSRVSEYIPIWGAFGFGGSYGGSFIRGSTKSKLDSGVVNCAVGAIVVIALECESISRQKLSL
ncbi:hypothetical protein SG34_030900 [Thalassomonas viridans]|uniref:Glutathionylspermidine synthase pre-ATP-grasp-like domain-containing protein n=1 Tax=Thalassomonas viridans TaxID=137584 RepID=A0AAE9Z9E1_9GAMM|nr:hypothetical protein [Thalassomonas viridans]WDE09175.1 hypothetical protein SG34_030900 [Thalassomonas viridans]